MRGLILIVTSAWIISSISYNCKTRGYSSNTDFLPLQLILCMKWISFVYENGYKVVYPWHKEDESGTVLQGTVTPSHFTPSSHSTLTLHTTTTGPAVWYEGQMEPQIGSFSSYVYFLFCPVLLYRDRYPRQPTNYWKAFGYFIQVRVQFILISVKITYARI